MNKENTHSLDAIIGRELSSVEFVRDYVQLRFDGPCLTAITSPVVQIREGLYKLGQPGYCDALCNVIDANLDDAFVIEGKELRLKFNQGTSLVISLRPEDYVGAEAAILSDDSGEWWVW